MNELQALIDKGWVLTVKKHVGQFHDLPYIADIAALGKEIAIGETFGHCHGGTTVADALECLESYVAAQGKGASRA